MEEHELAYAAGIIDGEGYIAIHKFNNKNCRVGYHYALKVTVGMGSSTVPMWLHLNFGGSLNIYKGSREQYKDRHIWQITTKQAGGFLELIYPYLKEKSGQAKIAIEFQQDKTKHWNKYNRRLGKPIAVIEAEATLSQEVSKLNRGA